jgi:hypothetical protein
LPEQRPKSIRGKTKQQDEQKNDVLKDQLAWNIGGQASKLRRMISITNSESRSRVVSLLLWMATVARQMSTPRARSGQLEA